MHLQVTDREWEFIYKRLSHLPAKHIGRRRADDRLIFEAIIYILMTGAPWRFLPDEFPAKSTVHRRFQQWCSDGSLDRLRRAAVLKLNEQGKLDVSEGFIDGSFIKAKKGAMRSGYQGLLEEKRALH